MMKNDVKDQLHNLANLCVYLWETEGENRRAMEKYMIHALYSAITRSIAFQACNCVLMLVFILATLHGTPVGFMHYLLLFAWLMWTMVAVSNILSLRKVSRMYTDAVLTTERAREARSTAVDNARQISRYMAMSGINENDEKAPFY